MFLSLSLAVGGDELFHYRLIISLLMITSTALFLISVKANYEAKSTV